MPAPQVSILTTVLKDSLVPCFKSYTLKNTPFYVSPQWEGEAAEFSQFQIIWNFDDGTTYVGTSAIHYYKFPGIYNVSATFFDKNGQPYTVTNSTGLSVYNVMPDTLVFDKFTPTHLEGIYLLPAGKKSEPLKIYRYNSWQNDENLSQNGYTVSLYASGSNSAYFSPTEYYRGRYSHLRNFFGFIETTITNNVEQTKIVGSTNTSSISVFALPVFDDEGNINFNFTGIPTPETAFIGTSGSITTSNKYISFIDQTPSDPGKNTLIYIFAHLDTQKLQDAFTVEKNLTPYLTPTPYGVFNTTWQTQYLKSVFNPAKEIAITSNGITVEGDFDTLNPLLVERINSFSIYPIKWTDSKISFCCTFKDSNNFSAKNYPAIKKFKFDGSAPTEINSVSLSLIEYETPTVFNSGMLLTRDVVDYTTKRITDAVFEENVTVPAFEKGGYFCGTLKTNTAVKAAVISACALIQDEPVLNLGITYGYAGQPGLNNIKRFSKKIVMDHTNSENLEFKIIDANTSNIGTGQNTSIGISVLPLENYKKGQNRIYVTDADNDAIQIYTPDGDLFNTIQFRQAYVSTGTNTLPITSNLMGSLDGATPASIALDSQGNAWISLYDAVSCFKFDYHTLTITACAVPHLQNNIFNTDLYNEKQGFVGENTLLPACLDTDASDNVLVGYSHPLSSFVFKYDKNGKYIGHISLPELTTVQEIIVDKDNYIYASVKSLLHNLPNPHYVDDYVYKWDSNLNLQPNFPVVINNIGRMTIDLKQNIYVNNRSGRFTQITPTGNLAEVNLTIEPETYMQYTGGIACDEEGFLWILHNQMGKIYFYPISETFKQLSLDELFSGNLPDIQLYNQTGGQSLYSVVGDWTGVRWINKYIKEIIPTPRYVYGASNLFSIMENAPVISKINENFDLAATLKGYVLQESLLAKPQLFDNFLGQIVGDTNSAPTELGKTIYEKIANFVSNKQDVDTCELIDLQSIYNLMGKSLPQFGLSFPPKLRRIINLLSIKQSKLYGGVNTYNKLFSNKQDNLNKNLGEEIDITTGKFIAGDPIVAYENFSSKFKIIYNTIVPTTDSIICSAGELYPLSGINTNWGWGLVLSNELIYGDEIGQFYKFYKYIPYMPLTPIDNIIDFSNPQTTFTNAQSSHSEWTKYGGIMDMALSRALYEGLELYE